MIEIIIRGPQGSGKTLIGHIIEAIALLGEKKVCRYSAGENFSYKAAMNADYIIREEQT